MSPKERASFYLQLPDGRIHFRLEEQINGRVGIWVEIEAQRQADLSWNLEVLFGNGERLGLDGIVDDEFEAKFIEIFDVASLEVRREMN